MGPFESNSYFIGEAITVIQLDLKPRSWVPALSAPLCCLPEGNVGEEGPSKAQPGHAPSSPSSGLSLAAPPSCTQVWEYVCHHTGPCRSPGEASPQCHPPSPALAQAPALWLIPSPSLPILICIHGLPPLKAVPGLLLRTPSDQAALTTLLG